jgi:3-oxoacid CoA-transferase subunit A
MTIAEVEEIVPVGSLDPDCDPRARNLCEAAHLGAPYDKKIEFRTVRQRQTA